MIIILTIYLSIAPGRVPLVYQLNPVSTPACHILGRYLSNQLIMELAQEGDPIGEVTYNCSVSRKN